MGFMKGTILFFLGMSAVLFMTRAFDVGVIAPNAVNFLKTIFLTSNGSNTATTGIVLEGAGGHGWFQGSLTIDSLPNAIILGTNASGKLIASTSGNIYNFISGFSLSGPTGATGVAGTSVTNGWITSGILYLQYSGVNGTGVWTLGQVQGATGDTGPQGTGGSQGPQGMTGADGTDGVTGAIPAHQRSGTTWLRFQLPNGTREPSFINLLGPIGNTGATGISGYAVVINIVQTGSAGTSFQCASTGNIISFYADKDYNGAYTTGTDTPLGSTIMCSDGAQGAQGPVGGTGDIGPQGNTGVQGATGIYISGAYVNTSGYLIITLSNNITRTGGYVKGDTGLQGMTGADGTDGVTGANGGTGSTGFLQAGILGATPFWSGSSWVTTSANIFNVGGNVGIGTSTPNNKIQVAGLINFDGVRSSTFLGWLAGLNNAGTGNTAIGYNAFGNSTIGSYNTAIGYNSFKNTTNGGSFNVAIGPYALLNSSGDANVAIGPYALFMNLGSVGNTAIGAYALDMPQGNNNTAIGNGAGGLATGSGNIYLGRSAGAGNTGDNRLYIGNTGANKTLIYGEFDNGKVGINNISPTSTLDVSGDLRIRSLVDNASLNYILTVDNSGTIYRTVKPVMGAGGSNYYTTGMNFNSGNNMLTLYVSGTNTVTGYINLSGVNNWNSAYAWTNITGTTIGSRYINTGIHINALAIASLNCSPGQIPKYSGGSRGCSDDLTGGSSLWTMLNGNIYNNNRTNGNVGIGLTLPTYKLTLSGDMMFDKTTSRMIKMQDVDYIGSADFSIIGSNASGGYTSSNGNTGGHIYIQGGIGGRASTSEVGGHGGNIYINGGSYGYGYTPSIYGQIIMANNGGKVGIATGQATAMLTVEGGVRPIGIYTNKDTGGIDPCATNQGNYPVGTMFYSTSADTVCYCNSSNLAKTMTGAMCN